MAPVFKGRAGHVGSGEASGSIGAISGRCFWSAFAPFAGSCFLALIYALMLGGAGRAFGDVARVRVPAIGCRIDAFAGAGLAFWDARIHAFVVHAGRAGIGVAIGGIGAGRCVISGAFL